MRSPSSDLSGIRTRSAGSSSLGRFFFFCFSAGHCFQASDWAGRKYSFSVSSSFTKTNVSRDLWPDGNRPPFTPGWRLQLSSCNVRTDHVQTSQHSMQPTSGVHTEVPAHTLICSQIFGYTPWRLRVTSQLEERSVIRVLVFSHGCVLLCIHVCLSVCLRVCTNVCDVCVCVCGPT